MTALLSAGSFSSLSGRRDGSADADGNHPSNAAGTFKAKSTDKAAKPIRQSQSLGLGDAAQDHLDLFATPATCDAAPIVCQGVDAPDHAQQDFVPAWWSKDRPLVSSYPKDLLLNGGEPPFLKEVIGFLRIGWRRVCIYT